MNERDTQIQQLTAQLHELETEAANLPARMEAAVEEADDSTIIRLRELISRTRLQIPQTKAKLIRLQLEQSDQEQQERLKEFERLKAVTDETFKKRDEVYKQTQAQRDQAEYAFREASTNVQLHQYQLQEAGKERERLKQELNQLKQQQFALTQQFLSGGSVAA